MDLKNLSKYKYIYRIYESYDEVLHCERYPVIYINSKVVYFKSARKQECLSSKEVDKVLDNFTQFCQEKYKYHRGCFDKYFWNIETNVAEIYEDLKKQRFIIRHQEQKRGAEIALKKAKKDYEAALEQIEAYNKMAKKYGWDW